MIEEIKSRKRSFTFGQAVVVTWVDSTIKQGWRYQRDQLTLATIQSLGYVVEKTRDVLVLTTSIGSNGATLADLHIPVKAILDLRPLPAEWNRL